MEAICYDLPYMPCVAYIKAQASAGCLDCSTPVMMRHRGVVLPFCPYAVRVCVRVCLCVCVCVWEYVAATL